MALVVPRNVAAALTKTSLGKKVLATNIIATVQKSSTGVSYNKIVTPSTKVKPFFPPVALPVVSLKKEVRTGGIIDTRVPTNFQTKTVGGGGVDLGSAGAMALGIGDVALDLSPVGVGMGLLSDVGNLAGMSLNALGIGGKKKAGGGGVYGRRRKGASYWRNRYEAMYWKAKYETARYGHGKMK